MNTPNDSSPQNSYQQALNIYCHKLERLVKEFPNRYTRKEKCDKGRFYEDLARKVNNAIRGRGITAEDFHHNMIRAYESWQEICQMALEGKSPLYHEDGSTLTHPALKREVQESERCIEKHVDALVRIEFSITEAP